MGRGDEAPLTWWRERALWNGKFGERDARMSKFPWKQGQQFGGSEKSYVSPH